MCKLIAFNHQHPGHGGGCGEHGGGPGQRYSYDTVIGGYRCDAESNVILHLKPVFISQKSDLFVRAPNRTNA